MSEQDDTKCIPDGPSNAFVHFIGPNPITSFNAVSKMPSIDRTAFIGPFSSVIGDVTMGANVFVAPNVSIRADEGTPFFIGCGSNLQDGVILHGLKDGRVVVQGREYSIYIDRNVSCAHGAIVHGPCRLGSGVFIGFHAIVFDASIGDNCFVSTKAMVTGGVVVPPGRFVPPGVIIDTQQLVDALPLVTDAQRGFAAEVLHVNQEFPKAYGKMTSSAVCSCGMFCSRQRDLRSYWKRN